MPQPWWMWSPRTWAMPSTIPPTSVPQSEPRPPMMTASYAKISRRGPALGLKVVRMPMKTPPMATMARAKAMAMPYR